MGPPIYQIQMYQKTLVIEKHTNITQEIPKFVPATEKYWKSVKKRDAPKGCKLKLLAIIFSITWKKSQISHPKLLNTTQQSK